MAAPAAMLDASLHRVRCEATNRSLRREVARPSLRLTIAASARLFSLFELRAAPCSDGGDGQCRSLVEYGTGSAAALDGRGWLTLAQERGGWPHPFRRRRRPRYLHVNKDLPPFPPSAPPPPSRRHFHPPPPPSAPPPLEDLEEPAAVRLLPHASGAYALRLPDGRLLCENATDATLRATVGRRKMGLRKAGAGVAVSCLFRFERIAPTPSTASSVAAMVTAVTAGVTLAPRLRRAAVDVGGRRVVVASAFGLQDAELVPLLWGWLEMAGIARLVLLHSEDVTCAAARALQEDALPALSRAQKPTSLDVSCVAVGELPLPAATRAAEEWERDDVPTFETATNYDLLLRRAKLRLVELALREGLDVVFVGAGTLPLSPAFLPGMFNDSSAADLRVAQDPHTGYALDYERCLRIPTAHRRWVRDWLSTDLFAARATPGSIWLLEQAQRLMDDFVLSDQDAIQVVLTGHAQVSDPRWAARDDKSQRWGSAAEVERHGIAFLKPTWLEHDHDPLTFGRELNRQIRIRPLNAPLSKEAWARLEASRRRAGFSWAFLPQSSFASTPPTVARAWDSMLGRGLGSMRVDGTRNGGFLALLATCQTRGWLAQDEHTGSFLFRPEPEAVTWQKFLKDFPEESAAIVARKRGGGGAAGGGKGGGKGGGRKGRKKRVQSSEVNEAKRQSRWKKAILGSD